MDGFRHNLKPGDLVEIPAYSEKNEEFYMRGVILGKDTGAQRTSLATYNQKTNLKFCFKMEKYCGLMRTWLHL